MVVKLSSKPSSTPFFWTYRVIYVCERRKNVLSRILYDKEVRKMYLLTHESIFYTFNRVKREKGRVEGVEEVSRSEYLRWVISTWCSNDKNDDEEIRFGGVRERSPLEKTTVIGGIYK